MPDLTVTLIQTALHWENIDANLAMFSEKINRINQPTQVVILPEMFSTGFSMKPEKLAETMDGKAVQWMRATAAAKKLILTGSLIIEENGQYYNRLIWMLPNGQMGIYDKRHLFAYAGENDHYSPGKKRLIAKVNGWKICLNVCYDLRFPVWTRQQLINNDEDLVPEYDVLLYVANWPAKRSLAWNSLLQARAIENQAYVIGLNRVGADGNDYAHQGDSSIIGPLGEMIYKKSFDEDIFTYTLSKQQLDESRQHFPFLADADHFKIL